MAVYHNLGHGCINDSDRQRRRRGIGVAGVAGSTLELLRAEIVMSTITALDGLSPLPSQLPANSELITATSTSRADCSRESLDLAVGWSRGSCADPMVHATKGTASFRICLIPPLVDEYAVLLPRAGLPIYMPAQLLFSFSQWLRNAELFGSIPALMPESDMALVMILLRINVSRPEH
ncbi:uncharacterized protein BO96DRAFT_428479 [Aspergillus niger CBS 101883]|uniref:uncharacterized protein n=1 Tax=Aspergillus lacticoffeatus (strain CBS 101883) TaxID=1450533 RepID=UPI000D7F014D|nr:uncharacterized protein BO96DRAFT_428479 [Aspergillus niger CBS 101883]PYH61707.1 hypothetical protein BO96DRAFT_428479 [Aspergillus niger CBS 101883]